jgi:dihydroneopterin aldolase
MTSPAILKDFGPPSVSVRIVKPHVAIAGVLDSLGVEITRTQEDYKAH